MCSLRALGNPRIVFKSNRTSLQVSRFFSSSTTSDLQQSLRQQEEKKAEEDEMKHLYKQKSEQEEFFGIPLTKKQPKNTQDVISKLRMRFDGPDELLSFYEDNRPHFQDPEAIKYFRNKLITLLKMEMDNPDSKPLGELQEKVRIRIIKDMLFVDFPKVTGERLKLFGTKYQKKLPKPQIDIEVVTKRTHKNIDKILSNIERLPVTPSQAVKFLFAFAVKGVPIHEEFMEALETQIIRHMNYYQPRQLSGIFTYYCRLNYGSEDWIKILLMSVQNVVDKLTPYQLYQVMYHLKGDFFINLMSEKQTKSVLVFMNQAMKNLDNTNYLDFLTIVEILYRYKITEKAYYELLAVTLPRFMAQYDITTKGNLIYKLSAQGIDESSIFNLTQETLREFLSSMINNHELYSEDGLETLQLQVEGFFNDNQIMYLDQLYQKNKSEIAKSQELLKELQQEQNEEAVNHLKHLVTSFSRLLWCYLYHCSDFYREGEVEKIDYALLASSVKIINLMFKRFPDEGEIQFNEEDKELFEEINTSLNLRFYDLTSEKQITIPQNVIFGEKEEEQRLTA
ncbi:unnamed protein product [Moneuplotes crassus]|uniref:Uncharacterized protein n=1 Tax=Euplotes crassus TaxID=5936 RepID=A0AAD1U717_EUPCR|nr:unnamed protein product [Moneuplotes crassus]